jgi:hypothetical protein
MRITSSGCSWIQEPIFERPDPQAEDSIRRSLVLWRFHEKMRSTKQFLLLAVVLLVGCGTALGETYELTEYVCPIDGTTFESQDAVSGFKSGMRLDLKPLGEIAAPWPIPVCPSDHFVVLEYEPAEIEKLKSFIPSDEYQGYASKHKASYALLAKIRDFLGAGPGEVGVAYLQASWEVEDRPDEHLEYLGLSLQYIRLALEEHPEPTEESVHLELLTAELERRLGHFDAAERRLQRLEKVSFTLESSVRRIIDYQLELVAKRDKRPHETPSGD